MEDDAGRLLGEAAWEVYAAPPADFVATRTAWVRRLREEGHKDTARAVGALRKPSVSAAAVNALARSGDPVLQQLRDVGSRLRHAQSALDGAGLTALRTDRDRLLAGWVDAARRHAPGGSLTAAVEAEVRDTAVAALAGAEATEVALSGTLTRALSYSGFGEVDVTDAVARTSTGVVLTRIEGGRSEAELDNDDEDAEGEDVEATEDDDEATEDDQDTDDAEDDQDEDDVEDDEDALEELRADLAEAEAEVVEARDRRRAAAAADTRAASEASAARAAVDEARATLEQAERQLQEAEAAQAGTASGLSEAEAALVVARERRGIARERLEEAEDAG